MKANPSIIYLRDMNALFDSGEYESAFTLYPNALSQIISMVSLFIFAHQK